MFDLDAVVGTAREPFRFTWGGKNFELPHILSMPITRQLAMVGAIERLGPKADARQILDVVHLIVGEELLAKLNAIKPVSAEALMALIQAWMQAQEGDLGKSPASSRLSGRTARPSKRTSRSTALRMTN